MNTITCGHLQRRFGKTVAVAGVELDIAAGEIYGLIGPDGAGKTTLLRMLAGVLRPNAGSIRIAGVDVVRQPEQVREVLGYMPQRFSLYADLSVLENLLFYADIFGVRGAERQQRIERLLAFARLEAFRDRPAGQLSGGMKKKLGLACALVHRPRVLLLDEPTNGVDPISRREFWDILADLHLEGVTILVTTPYMDEAERCQRVGLMHRGRILRQDTPAALRALVPGRMMAVYAGNLAAIAEAVAAFPGYLGHSTYGDRLHVFVAAELADPETALAAYLHDHGLSFRQILEDAPRLEEAFIHLIGHEKALP
jgi:ABC-2 type transport system ATP-binding protein